MAEYTYKDIIIDPNDPRLEGAIGKECYFSDYPKKVLDGARNNSSEYLDCLTNIIKEGVCPFVDKKGYGRTLIIIKKEEPKPKYVPFESIEEFIEAFDDHTHSDKDSIINTNLYLSGFWLKNIKKDNPVYKQVIAIQDVSILIGTIEYSYPALLENFTFLDGTPCGKLMEETNG